MTRLTLEAVREHLQARNPERIRAPATIEAAVAVVLAPGDDGVELLLIKRAASLGDPWSGQMALPGGRRDSRDGHLLQTAQRETLEETGIQLPPDRLLGELDDLSPLTKTLPPVMVRPFVFGLPNRPDVRPNAEVALHLWTSLEDLKAGAGMTEVSLRGERRQVPAYVVGGHIVWGMTWRILNPIIALVH